MKTNVDTAVHPAISRTESSVLGRLSFSMYYQNVSGMRMKAMSIRLFAPVIEADCLAITETWLSHDRFSAEFFCPEVFDVYRCDRRDPCKRTGGGVLIAVKNSFKSRAINMDHVNSIFVTLDIVGVEIILEFRHLRIFVTYIPPETSAQTISDFLDSLSVVVGDLNKKNSVCWGFQLPEVCCL